MLRTMKSLRGYRLVGMDDAIGKVAEFYFDDHAWEVRYLVADLGTWLPGRRVLLAPQAVGRPDWEGKLLPVSLTRAQIEASPPIEADEPVSRQREHDLHAYFGWAPYWAGDVPLAHPTGAPTPEEAAAEAAVATATTGSGDPHLRSSREVIGYDIEASDDSIGHVEDFVIECDSWAIRYMVVDTRTWLPGRKILVAPTWIDDVDWADRFVRVSLTRSQVEGSPEFDPKAPVNREYEARLYDYYGRQKYWG